MTSASKTAASAAALSGWYVAPLTSATPVFNTPGAAPTANTTAPATIMDTLIHTAVVGLLEVLRSSGDSSSPFLLPLVGARDAIGWQSADTPTRALRVVRVCATDSRVGSAEVEKQWGVHRHILLRRATNAVSMRLETWFQHT
jgi:hypothetical protein